MRPLIVWVIENVKLCHLGTAVVCSTAEVETPRMSVGGAYSRGTRVGFQDRLRSQGGRPKA